MSTAGPSADLGRSCRSSCSLGDAARTCLVEAKVKKAAGARLTSNGLNSTLRTRRCFALPPPPQTPQGRKEGGAGESKMCERGALCHHDIILKSVCDGRQAGRRAARRARARGRRLGSLWEVQTHNECSGGRRQRVAVLQRKRAASYQISKQSLCASSALPKQGRSHAAGFHRGRACSQGCSCCSRLRARSRKAT